MGVRIASVQNNILTNVLPASAVETIVCFTPAINLPIDFASIFILWSLDITAGTGTTALVIRLRRGTTVAGAQVGNNWTHTLAAGNSAQLSGAYFDVPGAVGGQIYALTVSQTGATVAGVMNDQSCMALVL